MAYNGSGVFNIDTAGQPVVDGTTIDATVFNALTADLASGLSTAITKDGQTTVTANLPMAGYKLTGLGLGSDNTDSAAVQNCNVKDMCEGRLTLESGVAVSTTDQSAKETLYFTPYKGNSIALYNGSEWVRRTFTELSIDVPDATNCYDVFAYDSSGTVTLELTAWTNETTRATALTTQNGVLVKTGATTRRYLGTFYSTTDGNGQIEDSAAKRHLWNYYHRVARKMTKAISATSYTYTTATVRQANGNAANQLSFVIGYSEDVVEAEVISDVFNSSAGVSVQVSIGLDGVTATPSAQAGFSYADGGATLVANIPQMCRCKYKNTIAVGRHYFVWQEYSAATGTSTWNSYSTNCIHGTIFG